MFSRPYIYLREALRHHVRDDPQVSVAGNMLLYYEAWAFQAEAELEQLRAELARLRGESEAS
jgi:hypothetical protein